MFNAKDRQKCARLLEKYYAGRKFNYALYGNRIRKNLAPGHRVLDAGCGRYLKFSKELPNTAEVEIDLEPAFETDNAVAPFAVRGDVGHLPFSSDYFDLVTSCSVVEHLENSPRVFREFHRVLRPRGKVVIATPNKYDYVSLIAAITPYRLHRVLVSKIFRVPEDDVFPIFYRANTISPIRKAFESAGLAQEELETTNHYPAHLMFSPVLFRLGILYERITSLNVFCSLRDSILCVFQRPGVPDTTSGTRETSTLACGGRVVVA